MEIPVPTIRFVTEAAQAELGANLTVLINVRTRGSNLNVQAQHSFNFDAVKKQAGEQFWNWAKKNSSGRACSYGPKYQL